MTKIISILMFFILSSCTPDLFKAAEDIATDTAIKVEVDKEAINKETNVHIDINVTNHFDQNKL
jgi:hypothetical protein